MAQEGREAHPRGGESSDGHEGGLGLGQSLGEVGCCRDCRRKPVSQSVDLGLQEIRGFFSFFFFTFFLFLVIYSLLRYKKSHGALAMAKTKPKSQNELTKETSGAYLFSWGPYRPQAHIRTRN